MRIASHACAEESHDLIFDVGLLIAIFEQQGGELSQKDEVVRSCARHIGTVMLNRLSKVPLLHQEKHMRRRGT